MLTTLHHWASNIVLMGMMDWLKGNRSPRLWRGMAIQDG